MEVSSTYNIEKITVNTILLYIHTTFILIINLANDYMLFFLCYFPQQAYHFALKKLKQAKRLRALVNADPSVPSDMRKQLYNTYSAFTELYTSYAVHY